MVAVNQEVSGTSPRVSVRKPPSEQLINDGLAASLVVVRVSVCVGFCECVCVCEREREEGVVAGCFMMCTWALL